MNINEDRKLIRARDIVLITAVLAAAAAVCFVTGIFSGDKPYAVISCGGETIAEISLDRSGDYSFPETGGMVFTVENGGISVSESGCPDKICMRTGSVSRAGEAIICVPNRTAVTVKSASDEDGVDVVLR